MAGGLLLPATMTIILSVVPHAAQRYDTVGDWTWNGDRLEIRVSKEVGKTRQDFVALVFVHELTEAMLCRRDGVPESVIDRFDMSYPGSGEPGDDPSAPYHREHQAAEHVERALAASLGIDWRSYERALDAVPRNQERYKGENRK